MGFKQALLAAVFFALSPLQDLYAIGDEDTDHDQSLQEYKQSVSAIKKLLPRIRALEKELKEVKESKAPKRHKVKKTDYAFTMINALRDEFKKAERHHINLVIQDKKRFHDYSFYLTYCDDRSLWGYGVVHNGLSVRSADCLTSVRDAFSASLNLNADSGGNINGTVQSVTVTPSSGGYNITLLVGDSDGSQTFEAKNVAPIVGGALSLRSTSNPSNVIVLNYDDDSVSALASAPTFQTALEGLLGLLPNWWRTHFYAQSISFRSGNIIAVSSTFTTPPGFYSISYVADSRTMQLDWYGNMLSAPVSQTSPIVTFTNGISVVKGVSFDHSVNMPQVSIHCFRWKL